MSKQQGNPSIRPPDSLARMMNIYADEYANSCDPNQRREALRGYLQWLSIILGDYQREMFGDSMTSFFGQARPNYFNFRPLMELRAHLLELDNGETPELFAPKTHTGRPPTSRSNQMWWAAAASTMTTLMRRFHRSEDEAAKMVVKQMRIRGISLPGSTRTGSPAWKQLQSWRDALLRGRKGRLARAWYDWDQFADYLSKTEAELFNSTLDPSHLPFDPLDVG